MSHGFIYDCNKGKFTFFNRTAPKPVPEPEPEREPESPKPKEPEPPKKLTPRRDRLAKKGLSPQQEKETIGQHQQEIEQAKAAQRRAKTISDKYEDEHPNKTFASNGKKTMSGWDGKTTSAPAECARVIPADVMKNSEKINHSLEPNMKDQGISGRFNASHAEKQLSILTDKPIGVSRKMCDDCVGYFSKQAQSSGKSLVVADPKQTRIFMPDGNIVKVVN
jgi:hypothetical protein